MQIRRNISRAFNKKERKKKKSYSDIVRMIMFGIKLIEL
jgi:hypothetical protein